MLPILRKLFLPLLFFLTSRGLSAANGTAQATYNWKNKDIEVDLDPIQDKYKRVKEEDGNTRVVQLYKIAKNDKNKALKNVNHFDKVEFSVDSRGRLQAYLQKAPGLSGFNDLTNHYVGQAVLFLQGGDEAILNINGEAVTQWHNWRDQGVASALPFGPALTNFAEPLTRSNAENKLGSLYRAFTPAVKDIIDHRGNPQVAHVVSDLLKMNSVGEIARKLYENQGVEASRMSSMTTIRMIRKHLIPLTSACGVVFGFTVGLNYVFKSGYNWVMHRMFLKSVIVESSMPENIVEWIAYNIFGKRKRILSQWKRMIHPPELMKELEAILQEFIDNIKYNMKIGRARRLRGEGMPHLHRLFYGPQGNGKTMLNRSLATLLYMKGLAHFLRIDGAEFGKLDTKEIPDVLNRIVEKAWSLYVRTGKPTILLIDEFDMLCPPRFARTTAWEMRELVSKLLATFPTTSSQFLVMCCTGNLNLAPGSKDRKKVDAAFLDRVGSASVYIGYLPPDLLFRVLKEAMVDYAKRRGGLKVSSDAFAALQEIAPALMKEFRTARQQEGLALRIITRAFNKRVKRRSKGRVIHRRDIEAVINEMKDFKKILRQEEDYGEEEGYDSDDY